MPFKILYNAFSFCFAKSFLTIFLIYPFIRASTLANRETEASLTICVR